MNDSRIVNNTKNKKRKEKKKEKPTFGLIVTL